MSLQKRISSFRYAINGLKVLFQTQPNARIHLAAAGLAVFAGFYFQLGGTEWLALTFCIAMVLSLEAMNTAIEYLTDLVSPEFHPLAGKAKDVAATSVMLASIGAVVVGGIIFLPRLWEAFCR